MRLLLDERYSPRIAERLRDLGHDVTAVAQSELAGLRDRPLMTAAIEARRALVTENVSDFLLIATELAHRRIHHPGIVITNARRFPRSRYGTGRHVAALDAFLAAHRDDDTLIDRVVWLAPVDDHLRPEARSQPDGNHADPGPPPTAPVTRSRVNRAWSR